MNNIILIGMPACGKSTAGVLLAKTAGLGFVDTDLLIQQREGMLLADIIAQRGIEGFLTAEEAVLVSIDVSNMVISTGGSAVYSEKGMVHLRKQGVIVYIELPVDEIKLRLNNIKTRGVVMREGETLESVYKKRVPLYEKHADVIINAAGMHLEELVAEILRKSV